MSHRRQLEATAARICPIYDIASIIARVHHISSARGTIKELRAQSATLEALCAGTSPALLYRGNTKRWRLELDAIGATLIIQSVEPQLVMADNWEDDAAIAPAGRNETLRSQLKRIDLSEKTLKMFETDEVDLQLLLDLDAESLAEVEFQGAGASSYGLAVRRG